MPRHLDELPVGITRSQFYLHANFATLHEEASAVPSRTSIIWLCPYAASAYRFPLRALLVEGCFMNRRELRRESSPYGTFACH
jgi:hypothetical protein